jgi:hypothetical protein
MFAEGIIALGNHEHHMAISPDGGELLWVIADRYRTRHTLVRVVEKDGAWLPPEVAPFSGRYNDFAPSFVPDGSALLFASNRPLPGTTDPTPDANLWEVERTASGWGEPHPLPPPVNDGTSEYNPSMTRDGLLVFQDHDSVGADIYTTRRVDGVWQTPHKIAGEVNTPAAEITPFVSVDGSTLVFASDREGGQGDMDLYVSHRMGGDTWSDPVNMGPRVNSRWPEAIPTLSDDGSVLFFTSFAGYTPHDFRDRPYDQLVRMLRSAKNGDGTLYWVAAEAPAADRAWREMTGLIPGRHAVGFRKVHLADAARPGIPSSGDAHRKVEGWVWYPAETAGAAAVTLSRYLDLAAEDFAHFAGTPRRQMASLLRDKLVAHGVALADLPRRLATPMLAREGARAIPGPLPLIILGQGLFYESPPAQAVLCEYLASHGFVVATAPLLGTAKVDMGLTVADLQTEVADLDFLRRSLPAVMPVDTTRVAVAGFDLGGMAALLLHQRHAGIAALVSMDSGIIFAHNMAMLEAVPGFRTPPLTIPAFVATRDAEGNRAIGVQEDLRYLAGTSDAELERVAGMRHPDFTSYALYATTPADLPFWGPPLIDPRTGYASVAGKLVAFLERVLAEAGHAGVSSQPATPLVRQPDGGLAYVWIPAGAFDMGCVPADTACLPREGPRHPVTLTRGFWLGETEVSVAAYARFGDRASGPHAASLGHRGGADARPGALRRPLHSVPSPVRARSVEPARDAVSSSSRLGTRVGPIARAV